MLNSAPWLNSLQGSKSTFWLSSTAKPTIMETAMSSPKSEQPRDFLVRQMIKKGAASSVRKMSASMIHSHGTQAFPSNCRLRNTNHTWQITEEQSAVAPAFQSSLSGSSVRPMKKQAARLTSSSTAHLTISSSKKYLPSSWKLFSLKSEPASLAPSVKMITQKVISTLQKATPPNELNHLSALGSLAAIVCRKEHSSEKRRERAARKSTGLSMLRLWDRVQMRQYPSQKLNTLKSSFSSARSTAREFTASLSSAVLTSSCFLISSFSSGARQESTMDQRVRAPTHSPRITAASTNKGSTGLSAGQSQTRLLVTESSCMAFWISVLLQTSGTQRPVKVSTLEEALRQSTRKQLQGVASLVCSHSYFWPGLLEVMPEYITKGRMVGRSSPICPVMIFSTNYMQSFGGAPHTPTTSSSNTATVFTTIFIIILYNQSTIFQ